MKIKKGLLFIDETSEAAAVHDLYHGDDSDPDLETTSSTRVGDAVIAPLANLAEDSSISPSPPRPHSTNEVALGSHNDINSREKSLTENLDSHIDPYPLETLTHPCLSPDSLIPYQGNPPEQLLPSASASKIVHNRTLSGSTFSYHGTPQDSTQRPQSSDGGHHRGGDVYLRRPQWPITNPQDAMLFRHFIQKLAPLFDMCDDERHFARVVPRRAVFCPPLMNAMLAASAKHLSRVSNFDGLAVDEHHQNCINTLIPILSTSAAIMDENLLPAIVILRFIEELDSPLSSPAPESHLLGTRVFVSAQEDMCGYTSLWRAAYWLALRQEIHMAFVQTRPIHDSFALEKAEQVIRRDDECDSGCSYANLIILHCAACIRYFYGSEPANAARWRELKETLDTLWEDRPWMFYPMYSDDGDSKAVFPVRQYVNDAVVTGVQHYLLVQILMAAHDPTTPKLGPDQARATREIDRTIKHNVRLLCGIAEVR